jgi:hypothetical protein
MPLSKKDLSAFARTSASLHDDKTTTTVNGQENGHAGQKTDIPSNEADDDVPPESVHETAPCPTDLQLEGVVKGEEDWVGSSRGRKSGC